MSQSISQKRFKKHIQYIIGIILLEDLLVYGGSIIIKTSFIMTMTMTHDQFPKVIVFLMLSFT